MKKYILSIDSGTTGVTILLIDKKLNKGDILVLAAFGSGFSWGSAILKW